MPKLPIVSGAKAVKALQRLGFFVDRQRGSHVKMYHGVTLGAKSTAGGQALRVLNKADKKTILDFQI